MSRVRVYLPFIACLAPVVSCAQCAPGKVGTGVARLSVRNFGAIVELVSSDTSCGFEAQHVKDAVLLSGEPGSMGTATYNVQTCTIDIPASEPKTSMDCNGTVFTIHGKVTVTAKKQIGGILTGDAGTPVIPAGPDAATIYVEDAVFENFLVESSISPNKLTMISGGISGQLAPRLGVDTANGACSIPTKNAMISEVIYTPGSRVNVVTDSRDFEVPVDGSLIWAVNGKHSGHENALSGTVVVWGGEQEVPNDDDGLDPDYDPALFESSFACNAELAQPTSFECQGFLGPRLAQNAARLTVRTLGRIASALEADTACGFSSPTAQAAATIDGAVGGMGSVTVTAEECVLDFGKSTVLQTSCQGSETIGSGRVVVRGTKRLTGRITGDAATPVVPTTSSPAEIQVEILAFTDLRIAEGDSALTIETGALSGTVRPMVVADTAQSGLCAFTTPIVRFSDIRYTAPTTAKIESTSGTFGLTIEDSNLMAVNGKWDSDENLLDGTIVVDGESWSLPTDPADDGLDPEYDAAKFDASWQCGTVQLPVSTQCDPTPPLAQGAAQLSIQTLGTLAKVLEADTTCGFSSPSVNEAAVVTGDLGYDGGSVVYSVGSPCAFDFGERTVVATDCNGKNVYASGRVSLTGTKTILGIVSGDPAQPVVPTDWEPAELDLRATFDGFAMWADPEANILEIQQGALSGVVSPRVAIDTVTGACSISTPTARMRDVAYEGASLTIVKDGLRFDLSAERSALDAQNGVGEANTNYLAGSIVVNGTSFTVPVSGQPILDPEYDQAVFDASYACTPDMVVPTDVEQCNMKHVLAEGFARLLVMSTGQLASQINSDDECGFEDFWVKTDPIRVEGDSGDQGLLEWEIEDCRHQNNGSNPVYVDCYGRQRFIDLDVTVDAGRIVTGERETILVFIDSIVPNTHDAVQIMFNDVEVQSYELWEREGDLADPFRGIIMNGGRLSGVVQPIVGERADEPGTFDVPTPVIHAQNVTLNASAVTLHSGPKTFKFNVDTSAIEAFNGSWIGKNMTNFLTGSVTMNGEVIELGVLPLDPAFDQTEFDARYACVNQLAYTIQPE